ncbi:heavy metal efflux pump, CzcA family [Candidatus Omnitrophus magneticus]|uniref:Heavy metal efflux pump, CzcA family n=1 Tax=Candidatus Omnitrophus magneticus TaxID=1609969 RepID=A0A0F0CRA8_9BACT|nr:heavy metal efflux pump, CzcA family [Candidatus Omnitrophus magneticus]
MNISEFSIKKPVTTIMLYAGFCLLGIISLTRLPVELYPNISFGRISIIMNIRGGIPPTEVESMVTRPIEDAVSTVTHLESMLSISKEGEATVMLSFEQGTDMQLAAMEVREKFAKVKEKLPKESEKPIIAQFSESDVPIVILAVTSDKRSQEDLRRIVDEDLKERIKRIKGVANVEVGGGRERKIIVEADKNALYRYAVSINHLISALGANNLNILTGELERIKDKLIIRAIGQYESIDDVKNTVVMSSPDGSVVRVKDISEVKDTFLEASNYSRINVKPVVSIYIQKESKGNTIEIARDIMKEVEFFKTFLPEDMDVIITKNQSEFIKTAIANLFDSLLRGSVMIIFVLMLFMGNQNKNMLWLILYGLVISIFLPPFAVHILLIGLIIFTARNPHYRSVLIVALSIPISVIITFGLMDFSNMFIPDIELTINFITLFGLALGVGMLVDNAIVVFENIMTKTEHGFSKIDAAIEGSSEMNTVIVGSTLTTVIVFLPMIFVGKSMSILYGGIAWTVTFSLTVSLFVALMIVPLMSSSIKLIHKEGSSKHIKEVFLLPFYRLQKRALSIVLRKRFFYIFLALAGFLGAMWLFQGMGKEYLGTTEQNRFTVFIELPTGAKLDASDEVVRKVEELLKEIPEVKDFTSRVEAWSSKVYVNLVDLRYRKRSINEVIESLRPKVARLQPAFIYFEEEQEVGTKEIILNVYGYDYDILREIAVAITTRMDKISYFTDTKIRMRAGRPELWIKIDKQKSSSFGFSTRDIADILHAKIRGVRATLFHTKASEIETIVRLKEKDRRTIKDIHTVTVSKIGDDKITVDQMSDFRYGLGPSEIWRKDRARMIQVSANIGQLPLSDAVNILEKELSDLKLPEDYFYEVGGEYQMLLKTQEEFKLTIIVILILIYLVMASLFESYKQPFIIMITVLLGTIGAILALYLTDTPVGMGALIGLMMLAGIVVNNGIILIDHANLLKKTQKNCFKIIFIAANDRLRPVLMTTASTIFGLIPMAIDKSEGSNLWNPLAITVIGGLLFATPFTLVLVPAIYSIFEQFTDILSKIIMPKKYKIIWMNFIENFAGIFIRKKK